jgi:hypothetical protein
MLLCTWRRHPSESGQHDHSDIDAPDCSHQKHCYLCRRPMLRVRWRHSKRCSQRLPKWLGQAHWSQTCHRSSWCLATSCGLALGTACPQIAASCISTLRLCERSRPLSLVRTHLPGQHGCRKSLNHSKGAFAAKHARGMCSGCSSCIYSAGVKE